MPALYEVKKVPKVVIQGIRSGEIVRAIPMNQYWFVIEHTQTGERYGEHDDEADAVAQCEQLNSQQKAMQ